MIRDGKKFRREMIIKLKFLEYMFDLIFIEWEVWIRGKRDDLFIYEEMLVE